MAHTSCKIDGEMFVFNDPGNHQGVVPYCSSGVTQAENCAAARGTEFAQNKMFSGSRCFPSVFRINFSRVLQSEITDAGLFNGCCARIV